jgi:DNA invertase Pin-like site-specific DNA recombinase
MELIYLRVSKKELDENTQLPEILTTFKLKVENCKILQERESAYLEVKQIKRAEFIKLKKLVEDGLVSDIYVYSLERLERNIVRLFEFYFFCEAHNCRVHGALQPSLELRFDDNPIGTFSRYQQVLMFGLLGENESYMTSKRTKKAVLRTKGVTFSKGKDGAKGNKWGRQFKDELGNPVSISATKNEELVKFIVHLIKIHWSYSKISIEVLKKFGIKVSAGYISKQKQIALGL